MRKAFFGSLIIATYNWSEALKLCLDSVMKQKVMPSQIIIADDGSGTRTRELIERFCLSCPIPAMHIWHEDNGFQLAQIRNKANAEAEGDYLIQIDGDVILHPYFVKEHIEAARAGFFIGGSRVILNESLSAKIFKQHNIQPSIFQKGVANRLNGLHFPAAGKLLSTMIHTRNAFNIRGCNMSYWKKDFVAVNGYNEAYEGWGREDTDLVMRFYRAGLQRTYFKGRGIVYHLWHREAERKNLSKNEELLRQTMQNTQIRSERGIDQWL